MNWAFVDPKTPIQQGAKFCICVKEFLPWLMMPLQVVYVNETKTAKNRGASFGFGSGTLQGHLLVTSLSLMLDFLMHLGVCVFDIFINKAIEKHCTLINSKFVMILATGGRRTLFN